jgi:hypothetical protein
MCGEGNLGLVLLLGVRGTLLRLGNCWRRLVSSLKAPSAWPFKGQGVVTLKAEDSRSSSWDAEGLRIGAGGQEKDHCGAGPILATPALVSCVASRPSRPFSPAFPGTPWPCLCKRYLSFGRLGWDVSGPGECYSPSRLPGTKINHPALPPPTPDPAFLGAFRLGGVQGHSVCWRHGAVASLPSLVLPEAPPTKPFLPPAEPGSRGGRREWGRQAKRARGRRAGGRLRALGRLSPARTIAGA